jgi:hypothetical protein
MASIHNNQIKSQQRVTDHGEVYTHQREVNAMLDLVKAETERIDSRFFEPACGTGNFLVEVLRRKLSIVENRYKKSQREYERYAILAVSSIYGIDLLSDNIEACKKRLFKIFKNSYKNLFEESIKNIYLRSIRFILNRNIIQGDALTLKTTWLTKEPIIFSEWSLVYKDQIKRRDFTLSTLLNNQPMNEPNLFSDLGDEAFIPTPIAEYPLRSFYQLNEDVQREL